MVAHVRDIDIDLLFYLLGQNLGNDIEEDSRIIVSDGIDGLLATFREGFQ